MKICFFAGVNHRKMASNDDGDLIDLGNDACVPRVSVDDPTLDEQEHLLDVCPPKLEQKLSLTKRQEQVSDSMDSKGDILVTLGHDQVVPVHKRIDVVSSDTIKRVRNITRNLEPVIRRTRSGINEETQQDTVDHGAIMDDGPRRSKHDDETYEAQEINNAFNFLAEHDDNVEDHEAETAFDDVRNDNAGCDHSLSSTRPLIEEEDDCPFDMPSVSEEMMDRSDAEERRDTVTRHDDQYDIQLDNPAYESSPNSRQPPADAPGKQRSVPVDAEPHTVVVLKRRDREDVAFKRESKRRSLQESHHKSWTEGASLNGSAHTDGLHGIDRSTSLEVHRCAPSTSEVGRGISSFLTRYDCFYQYFHGSPPREVF